MKRSLLFSLALASFTSSAMAQIIGFYNVTIQPGNNLIANELSGSPDNTLNNVLQYGVLAGSTFTEWDPLASQPLPVSVFDGMTWSINYTLAPDETGGILNSPGSATVMFIGTVVNYNLNAGQSTFVPPARGPGIYLLGYAVPFTTTTFQQIIGRDPVQGDWVETLDNTTQITSMTTFLGDAGWNNGAPSIPVGDSAYFGLEVPEPSVLSLGGMGAAVLLIGRSRAQAST